MNSPFKPTTKEYITDDRLFKINEDYITDDEESPDYYGPKTLPIGRVSLKEIMDAYKDIDPGCVYIEAGYDEGWNKGEKLYIKIPKTDEMFAERMKKYEIEMVKYNEWLTQQEYWKTPEGKTEKQRIKEEKKKQKLLKEMEKIQIKLNILKDAE